MMDSLVLVAEMIDRRACRRYEVQVRRYRCSEQRSATAHSYIVNLRLPLLEGLSRRRRQSGFRLGHHNIRWHSLHRFVLVPSHVLHEQAACVPEYDQSRRSTEFLNALAVLVRHKQVEQQ